jgi:phage terminase large subunit-like protein
MGKNGSDQDWILTYYQGIKNGSETVGQWILAVYEYIVTGLNAKLFCFDQKKANDAVNWIESHCFHVEGPLAPGPLKLSLWQKALISCIFGLVNENGQRQFSEILLVIGRKQGKSALAAAIAKYMWWVAGGYGAKIFTIAPKLDQADIIYNNLWQQVLLDPEWQEKRDKLEEARKTAHVKDDPELARHRQQDLYLPSINSTVKKIAFSARKSDGFNPSLCICDEIASWQGDNGLKQYEVMKSGMGARGDAIMLSCTTAGYVDGSIYDELLARSTRFLLGNSKEKKLLPFLYVIDDPEKWNDINELRKSNPNLNVSVPVDFLLEEIAVAEGSLSKKAEFMTKYCCVKQHSSLAWLPAVAVERAAADPLPDLSAFKDHYAVIGIDLSRTTDLSACTAVIQKNGELYVFAKFFMPGAKLEEAIARDGLPYDIYVQRGLLKLSGENFIDYHDVYNWCCELVERWKIYPLQVGYDRYSAQYLVQDLEVYGFHTDDVFQSFNLTSPIREFEGLMRDGRIHIGDNDLLKIHLLNAALKHDTQTERVRLVKIQTNDHIDGTAALLDAFTVRQKHWKEIGGQLENTGR